MAHLNAGSAGVTTLIVATAGAQLANGFFGTFFSLRVALEHYDPTVAGLVLSSYFVGYTLGAVRSQIIIDRLGHIRSYVAFAGLIVAATSAMPALTGAIPWLILRGVVGFGCAGLFVATESWLSSKSPPQERGRIFARYMLGNFLALALGQLLIIRANVESSAPFSSIAAIFAVALIIMSMTRAEQPEAKPASPLPYGELSGFAPLAVIASALSGLINSTFYAVVPAWMQSNHVENNTIGVFMFSAVLGGLLFQLPIGRLSDHTDRRTVLGLLGAGIGLSGLALTLLPHTLLSMLPAAAIFGGFMSTIYPVSVAHAHDRMGSDHVVSVSGRLILVYGLGSMAGPLVGAVLMRKFEIDGVVYMMSASGFILAVIAMARLASRPSAERKSRFRMLAPQTPASAE